MLCLITVKITGPTDKVRITPNANPFNNASVIGLNEFFQDKNKKFLNTVRRGKLLVTVYTLFKRIL